MALADEAGSCYLPFQGRGPALEKALMGSGELSCPYPQGQCDLSGKTPKYVSMHTCKHYGYYHKAVSNWSQRKHPDGEAYVKSGKYYT